MYLVFLYLSWHLSQGLNLVGVQYQNWRIKKNFFFLMLSSILYISEKIRSQGNKGFYPEILHIGLVGLNHLFCGTPYQCGLALISHCYSLMLDLAQGPPLPLPLAGEPPFSLPGSGRGVLGQRSTPASFLWTHCYETQHPMRGSA